MWKIIKVRYGEHNAALVDGWEPFAVVANIETTHFRDSYSNQKIMEVQSNDYIYLRKEKK